MAFQTSMGLDLYKLLTGYGLLPGPYAIMLRLYLDLLVLRLG